MMRGTVETKFMEGEFVSINSRSRDQKLFTLLDEWTQFASAAFGFDQISMKICLQKKINFKINCCFDCNMRLINHSWMISFCWTKLFAKIFAICNRVRSETYKTCSTAETGQEMLFVVP